jgi:hypothetical protein
VDAGSHRYHPEHPGRAEERPRSHEEALLEEDRSAGVLAAKAVWKKGLISADACNARIAAIEAKYLDLHTKNTDWAQDLQADIQDRFEAKVELWKARK